MDVIKEIQRLKKEKNAIILAHYYQDDSIQDIADFIGDSLELSKKARDSKADVILFSGVKFMAETAKILSPNSIVLVPDLDAGCSLEESCKAEDFVAFRQKYPDHTAITYINCSAEVKAASDIICTSSNAERIINSIPRDQKILFAPDRFLGKYLIKKTGRDMLLWDGSCIVHERFSEERLVKLVYNHPKALVIAHPECPQNLLDLAHFTGSTSALLKYVGDNKGAQFIVLTEAGIIHQMRKLNPSAEFLTVPYLERDGVACVNCNTCPFMRLNTLEKIYTTLRDGANEITIPQKTMELARRSLDRMMEY